MFKTTYSFECNCQFSSVYRKYQLDIIESVFADGCVKYVIKQFPQDYREDCDGNDYFFVSLKITKLNQNSGEEKTKLFMFSWVKDCPPPYFSYIIENDGLPLPTTSIELD